MSPAKSPLGGLFARCLSSSSASPEGELLKTELWNFHVDQGAKMVDFTGWSMPLQYKDSIIESVNNVRTNAGVFDVSHMCGHVMKGRDAVKYGWLLLFAQNGCISIHDAWIEARFVCVRVCACSLARSLAHAGFSRRS